jgi:Fibronectin type III domain
VSAPGSGRTVATTASPPTRLSVMGVNQTSASLTWDPPDFDGGSEVVAYEAEVQPKCRAGREHWAEGWTTMYQARGRGASIGIM